MGIDYPGRQWRSGDADGRGDPCYAANASMKKRFFYNADGEMLLVPQEGALTLATELGVIAVAPGEIAVIPRGVKFRVEVEGGVRGYICENYGLPFRLPELGPIGANGLANSRDFLTPVAAFEDAGGHFSIVSKFLGKLVGGGDRSLAAGRSGVARELCAV